MSPRIETLSRRQIAFLLAAIVWLAQTSDAQEISRELRRQKLDKVYELLRSGDSFAAAEWVEQQGEPLQIALIYSNLVRDMYGAKRDVPGMLVIGQAGIHFCRLRAADTKSENPTLAGKFLGLAKTMAFNASVNTWPGWDEKDITISRSELQTALDLAQYNLRMAEQLRRSADIKANAHWLLGAQHLALTNHKDAAEQFRLAANQAAKAKKPDSQEMSLGYLAITLMQDKSSRQQGEQQLDDAIEALKKMDSDDAKFYAQQLTDVTKFFENWQLK